FIGEEERENGRLVSLCEEEERRWRQRRREREATGSSAWVVRGPFSGGLRRGTTGGWLVLCRLFSESSPELDATFGDFWSEKRNEGERCGGCGKHKIKEEQWGSLGRRGGDEKWREEEKGVAASRWWDLVVSLVVMVVFGVAVMKRREDEENERRWMPR
ncbi:hypothetical protein HAX54_046610, partial [Datura stramonium]|nr:hypothetical protein [Datura stramonium]